MKNYKLQDIADIVGYQTAGAVSKRIDRIAEQYADNHKLSKLIIRPEYHKYGRAAPIRRNKVIVDEADEILAFWDGVSKGTKSVIDYAKKQGKPIRVYQGSGLILAIPHSR